MGEKIVYKVVRPNRTSFSGPPKMSLSYPANKTTEAPKDTLGIFCFKTKRHAEVFVSKHRGKFIILKVRPIGRKLTPIMISSVSCVNLFYHLRNVSKKTYKEIESLVFTGPPPKGTACYKAVYVLE